MRPSNWPTGASTGRRSTGMKRTASAGGTSSSSASSTDQPRRPPSALWAHANFAVCVETGGYVDLELRRLYRVRSDKKARSLGFVRVVDDSGDDYLYPASFFEPVRLPERVARAFRRLA